MRNRWRSTELWQYAATLSLIVLVTLALVGAWPFDAPPIAGDRDATLAELALGDRLTIGLIRTAVLAVVGYVVVSVPALVLDRRWMQALTTTGLTTDRDRTSDPEELSADLADVRALAIQLRKRLSKAVSSVETPDGEVDDDDG